MWRTCGVLVLVITGCKSGEDPGSETGGTTGSGGTTVGPTGGSSSISGSSGGATSGGSGGATGTGPTETGGLTPDAQCLMDHARPTGAASDCDSLTFWDPCAEPPSCTEPPDAASVADACMQAGVGCPTAEFLTREAAICIAEAHGLTEGLEGFRAVMAFGGEIPDRPQWIVTTVEEVFPDSCSSAGSLISIDLLTAQTSEVVHWGG